MKGSGIMKKNLQEMEVKAINKSAILESHDGEEFSLITVAKNVLCEDGTTMQDYFDSHSEPNISTKIVNSNSMSKVGQGDNVDFSDNVMNGAYEDVVLKGKSLVNVIQEPSSQDVVLPYAFEDGQYVTINDTKEGGALGVELKGQTLVNSFMCQSLDDFLKKDNVTLEDGVYTLTGASSWNTTLYPKMEMLNVKPSTTYTLILYVYENTTVCTASEFLEIGEVPSVINSLGGTSLFDTVVRPNSLSLGANKFLLTTKSDFSESNHGFVFRFYPTVSGELKLKFSLIEGNHTDTDIEIPYFTGMQSVHNPIIKTEQNLFDPKKLSTSNTFTYSELTNIGRFEFTNRGDVALDSSIQLPAGTYNLSFRVRGECENGRVAITFKKDGQVWHGCERMEINYNVINPTNFKEVKSTRTFDAPVTVTLVGHGWAGGSTGSGWCEFKDIRFTPVGKTSILSLPEEVVLRSLPSGVCDTFNTRTGVYTQRIWSATFNGTESYTVWGSSSVAEGMTAIYTRTKVNDKIVTSENQNGLILCDTLPTIQRNQLSSCQYDSVIKGNNYIGFTMKGKTSEEIKQWLSENPTTVCCELKTPIVTKINLPSTLKSWNTTTHIYSEIPENTLYPILSHSNPTYPVILKPSTKYSIVANSYSNNHINSTINFNLGGATVSTTVGSRVTTITTPSALSNELLTMSGRGNKLNNVMVIEGDVVGDEPYFEGICDVKSPIVKNVGKNLFDKTKVQREKYQNYNINNGAFSISNHSNYKITDYIRVKPNTSYVSKNLSDGAYYNVNKEPIKTTFCRAQSFTVPSDAHYVVLNMGINTDEDIARLEEVPSSTTYEPYKSNTTTFTSNDGKTIVLRSLPNGVCDTLNLNTGEYVQRIGEVVFDGSSDEVMWFNSDWVNGECVACYWNVNRMSLPNKKFGRTNMVCDKFPTVRASIVAIGGIVTGEGIWGEDGSSVMYISLNKTKLTELSANGFRRWASQNPVTVQYELATPIVKQVNVEGYPYAYENGHVLLESGSQEQSLTPKVEYSIVANRGGQIRSNQRMVERHQKKLDSLYAMTLVNMIDSQYKQVLMKLKSELGSEVRTWDIE